MEILHKKRKWIQVKEQLRKQIVTAHLKFNQRFLGIQQVAAEHDISYLTARKALKSLEDEGYLRCRNGVGYFVSYIGEETELPPKNVQFIVSSSDYRVRKKFFIAAKELFRSRGWYVRIAQYPTANISSIVEEINSPDAYSIVCGIRIPWNHLQASLGNVAKRVLILGGLAGNSEISSIISDENETIRRAINYFAEQGRRNIAIISQEPKQELEALRIGTWQSLLLASGHSFAWTVRHCFSFSGEKNKESWENTYSRLLQWLQSIKDDTDGLIIPINHVSVIDGCLRCGMEIPNRLKLLLIARSTPVFEEILPRAVRDKLPEIDLLDHNYMGHFERALEILEERVRSGRNNPVYWYFCPSGEIQKCSSLLT